VEELVEEVKAYQLRKRARYMAEDLEEKHSHVYLKAVEKGELVDTPE
jgi:hypothetical protein